MALARKINLTFYLTTFKLQHRKAATAKEWFFLWHKSCLNQYYYSQISKNVNFYLKLTPEEKCGMEAFEGFQDKEFDLLNEAILKAIVSSPDVENVLQLFKSNDLINEMSVVNLIISLEELSGLMLPKKINESNQVIGSTTENLYKNQTGLKNKMVDNPLRKVSREPSKNCLVDGKLLSGNEILFEEHFQGSFNEKQWLERAKIKSIEKIQD